MMDKCPYCDSTNIEFIDADGIYDPDKNTDHDWNIYRCKDCKEEIREDWYL